MKPIITLLRKEMLVELRNKGSFYANLIFVLASTYIVSLLIGDGYNLKVWSAIFWVVMMFTSFNITLNNSLKEGRGRLLYQYTLFKPWQYFTAKFLWFSIFITVLNVIGFGIWMVLGVAFQNIGLFFCVLLLNSIVFSSLLALMSFLSAKAGGGFALMSILSLPILIPDLLLVAKLSTFVLDGFAYAVYSKYFIALGMLSVISLTLGLVLFPYLWRE